MNTPPPQAPAPSSGRGMLRWAPVLVILAAWLAHAGAREGTWILDDVHLVRDNKLVARGPAAVPHIFAGRGDPVLVERYGALTLASFALEAPLWKGSDGTLAPHGFHLTNLLLHGLCALLLLHLLLGLLPGRPLAALAGALLFAVHPLHTGTVATLMGRAELLATLFALLTAFAWRAWARRRFAWLPLAALAWLLALQASPLAIGVPLVLLLLDRARPPRAEGAPLRLAGPIAILVLAVPLGIFLATWGGVPSAGLDLPHQSAAHRVGLGFEGLARMVLGIVVPLGFRGDHTDEAIPGAGYEVGAAALAAAGVAVLLLALALWRARHGRAGAFSVTWIATLALAVPASLVRPAGAALEAPFAYLVALPLFAASGVLAQALFRAGSVRTSASFALARGALVGALVVIALVGLTHREALGYRDDEAFHERLLDRNPQHIRAMVRLARSQRRAAEELRAASAALPADHPKRSLYVRLRAEALERSSAWGRRAVRHDLGRRSANAWRELGLTQLAGDHPAAALRSLELARELDPQLRKPVAELLAVRSEPHRLRASEMYFAIARCRESLGNRETAADAYYVAWRLDEGNLRLMRIAGLTLCRVNRYAEGLPLLLEARRRTQDRKARKELDGIIERARRSAREIAARLLAQGEAKQAEGKMREAVTLYERALEVNRASPRALIRAGYLRGMWFGAYGIAEKRFREAEALLRKGGVPETDEDWRQLREFRRLLEEQKRDEEAELERGDG